MPGAVGEFFSWAGLGIPAFLFVITIIVFFHELGHFLVARMCGVSVQAFSIGFGRELFGWTDRTGTRWKVSLLPLGGYVKFAGDADPSSRPDEEALNALDEKQRAGILHFKPLYQRALVVAAGPVANFILALVIFTALFAINGKLAEPTRVDQVIPNSAAQAAGIQNGDLIEAIDGKQVPDFLTLQSVISASAGKSLQIRLQRNGMPLTVTATPRPEKETDESGVTKTVGLLGIHPGRASVGVGEAVGLAGKQTWMIVDKTMGYLGQLVTGRASPDQLSGPLGIAKVSGDMAALGFLALMNLAALISVSIGLLNLFPIPVLDGGHLLYYAFEAVLGRPLGERAQEVGFRLGLAFVLCLMLLATFNDLVRFNLF